jgi:transcriptional regulator with XRE-family HTH domain
LLKERGLTQTEAALVLDESQANISRWLSGDNEPTLTKAVEVATRLGVPIAEFTVPSKFKAETGQHLAAAHQIVQLPTVALKHFKTRFRTTDPDLREFMSGQVRALFGRDAKKIMAWLNGP